MEWIYMPVLHASSSMLAITADMFIMENMLLTRVAVRYYGIHKASGLMNTNASFRWWVIKSPYYYHTHQKYL